MGRLSSSDEVEFSLVSSHVSFSAFIVISINRRKGLSKSLREARWLSPRGSPVNPFTDSANQTFRAGRHSDGQRELIRVSRCKGGRQPGLGFGAFIDGECQRLAGAVA